MDAAPPALNEARPWLGAARLVLAALALAAVVVQFVNGTGRPGFEPANFLSFFTIQSNVLAAVVLCVAGVAALRGHPSGRLTAWRGAATLYMAATGIVYVALLRGLEESLQTPLPWVNAVLHYVMPAGLVADWLIDRPRERIEFRRALPWLAFPLAYAAYSLIRGEVTGWYPYPFLDAEANGYATVLIACVGVAAAILAVAWCVAWRTRWP